MTLETDTDGNLIYSQTEFSYLSGMDGLLQDLTYRLRLLSNEYKLDIEGINYPLLMNSNNKSYIRQDILTELHKDPRVSYVNISESTSTPHTLCLDVYVKSN